MSRAIQVAKSCKTPEQLANVLIWTSRIKFTKTEKQLFVQEFCKIPNADLAAAIARANR
jgi:hypothetical protein